MQKLIWLARCKLILVSSHWAWLLSWSPSAQSISRAPRSIQDWDERSHCDLHIIINLMTTQHCLVSQSFILFLKYTSFLFLCIFRLRLTNVLHVYKDSQSQKHTQKHASWYTNADYYVFHMCKLVCVVCFACLPYVSVYYSLNVTLGMMKGKY